MAKIKNIVAEEIIDSRAFPTILGRLFLDNGSMVETSVPAGTSIGKYEAVELRDGDMSRFGGMGVSKAVSYINNLIAPKLVGVDPQKQQEIDSWLIKADGTKDKSKLGANTILTISQLATKAASATLGIPLFAYINKLYKDLYKSEIKLERIPVPLFNIINGGKHANDALNFQEFHVIPSSSFSFSKAYQIGVEFYHELRQVLLYRNSNTSVGEEGGFAPNFATNTDALEILKETLVRRNLKLGVDVFFGLDLAASYFYKDDRYVIRDRAHPMKVDEYLQFVTALTKNYSILILEDPINQDDWSSWSRLNSTISQNVYLTGDDLIATNKERLEKAIKEKACSAVIIKLNQIGTVTETLGVVDLARKNNLSYIFSHRSGESNDSFIADFSVGIQADFVKFGGPSRGERVAKYNRLWEIERQELKV